METTLLSHTQRSGPAVNNREGPKTALCKRLKGRAIEKDMMVQRCPQVPKKKFSLQLILHIGTKKAKVLSTVVKAPATVVGRINFGVAAYAR